MVSQQQNDLVANMGSWDINSWKWNFFKRKDWLVWE